MSAEPTEYEKKMFAAKLAEQAERYDEMRHFMKQYVIEHPKAPLKTEGRNLLSVAYKNAVGTRRASWRVVQSVEMKHEMKGSPVFAAEAKKYRMEVRKELVDICDEVLNLIDTTLLVNTNEAEADELDSKVFYEKMKGDYYRYICECSEGEERTKAEQNALKAYQQATERAEKLPEMNAVRLGLALNFSVFYYEIMNDCEKACQMAHAAFDHAVKAMDSADNKDHSDAATKDSTLIMQLLRDNLNLWVPAEGMPEGGDK